MFLPTMDRLNSHLFMQLFYISLGLIINYLLWQCRAYALVRFSQKKTTWLVLGKDHVFA